VHQPQRLLGALERDVVGARARRRVERPVAGRERHLPRHRLRDDVAAVQEHDRVGLPEQPLARERVLLEVEPLQLRREDAVGARAPRLERVDVRLVVARVDAEARGERRDGAARKYSCGIPSPALIICRHRRYEPERGVLQMTMRWSGGASRRGRSQAGWSTSSWCMRA
jgi:hypothetical protein